MDTLTQVYFVAFVAGAGFAIVSWLLGSHGHGHGHGHGVHGHAHGAHGHGAHGHGASSGGLIGKLLFPLVNLSAWSAFACVGGGVGFLARRQGSGRIGSLVLAVACGLVAAYAVGALIQWLHGSTRYVAPLEKRGLVATVLHRVPASGTGEIAYLRDGARATMPAVSANGTAIDAGAEVVVIEVSDGIAKVAIGTELFGEERK